MAKKEIWELVKAGVYGANDGIVTTFAVVAGVSGAQLPTRVILILGVANMVADGLSMALGDYLGERSAQAYLKQQQKEHKTDGLWRTGLVTFFGFVVAGSMPLAPYWMAVFGLPVPNNQFAMSIIATGIALFVVGSLRTLVIKGSFIKNGMEMFGIGAIAALVAYVLGAGIEQLLR